MWLFGGCCMDTIVNVIDTAVKFTEDKVKKAIKVWDGFDDDKKKLCTCCVVVGVCLIVIVGIAYGIGKAHGRSIALEEEDF